MDFNAKKYVSFLILIFVGLFAEFIFFLCIQFLFDFLRARGNGRFIERQLFEF